MVETFTIDYMLIIIIRNFLIGKLIFQYASLKMENIFAQTLGAAYASIVRDKMSEKNVS
jgi:hypothetical protein